MNTPLRGTAINNSYPLWAYGLLIALIFGALLYAWPNVSPLQPALQIGWADSSLKADESLIREVERVADDAGIELSTPVKEERYITYTFTDSNAQLRAHKAISEALISRVIVALSLVDATPKWLKSIGAEPLRLGLDLRGGVYFLLELNAEEVITERTQSLLTGVRRLLREEGLRYISVNLNASENAITVKMRQADEVQTAMEAVGDSYSQMSISDSGQPNGQFTIEWTEQSRVETVKATLEQNLVALRNRVNELGSESSVSLQGSNRIVVQLPGVKDAAAARRIIGKTATLEFRLEANSSTPSSQREVFDFLQPNRAPATLEERVVITGNNVVDARATFDEQNAPVVSIQLDGEGGNVMFRTTRENIGRRMGTLLVESRLERNRNDEVVRVTQKKILTLPRIKGNFGDRFQIEGVGTSHEASELALLLRAGALAAPMDFVQERVIGPTLGLANINRGLQSMIVGFCLVVVFMLLWYRVMGAIACVALIVNLVLITSIMSILGITLTLPGIAGIVLTVGMAVDANVLILARIKEELQSGAAADVALHNGYAQAFITILDANITTLLTAVVLYAIGTGPIQGFAITLAIGILTSMFTAVVGTRAIANLLYGRKSSGLSIGFVREAQQ